ncbi:Hypothetical predicted protein [Lecanosticta acicola]|uniref:DUF605-domain-containing protein n=1 Tax=Lecanosticta acicola TaxID=111012 RepID=A0AAI8Z436_9PEZI|nr:Hypothetical predicted protein [Lecanosticta acicola]
MASAVPAKLKAAAPDVQRFVTRAAQLEKFRPIVSYWCEYFVLQQILNRQLHTQDEECTQYAMQLMDKMEAYKATNASNDAVIDDVAAKAYIENFALDTFSRGDEAQRNNKVTKQTADTFQASATFMDLLSIWGPLEPEIQAKLRFAKYHALRIAKAIKAGEDPNATNPAVEPEPKPDGEVDDGIEAELKDMENDTGAYKKPTVESAPDNQQPSRPQSTFQTDPLQHPLAGTNNVSATTTHPTEPDVSPIEPTDNINSRAGSVGGGYFPSVPDAPSNVNVVAPVGQPPSSMSTFATADPADFYSDAQPQGPTAPGPSDLGIASPDRLHRSTPHQMVPQPPAAAAAPMPAPKPPVVAPPPVQAPPAQATINLTGPPPGGYKTDDESILAAQKHAKWAISALNFEDVDTAVKELRIALNNLGAS